MKNPSSRNKLLVFDFDGVLAQSQLQMHEAIVHVALKMRLKLPSVEELRSSDARLLLKKMGVGKLRALWMVYQCQRYLQKKEAPPITQGMKELLLDIQSSFVLGIVSTSPRSRIESFLKREGLEDCFDFIRAPVSLWGKDKALWDVSLSHKGLKLLYVGDEERDTICAHKAGYQVISVPWGAKDGEFLKSYRPEYFVETVEVFERLLKSFD